MRATNPNAHRNYRILDKIEAGVSLTGPEVKSVKMGHVSLKESYVRLVKNEIWWINAHISPYSFAENSKYDPKRSRKLLLHRDEIDRIARDIEQKGLTLVPLSCYTSHRRVKLEIGLGKGKKQYEKRDELKKRDIEKEIKQKLKDSK